MLAELERSGEIGILHLRRPEAANALNGEILREIFKIQTSLRSDRRVRVLITLGEGKGFCAGSDLREQAKFTPQQAEKSQLLEAKICREFLRLPQPTIAAVHGYALGGGFFLATHHDFQIIGENARLGLPEVKLGWNPTFGNLRLCQLAGLGAANFWLMLGDEFSPDDALRHGCATQIVPATGDVFVASRRFAERLLQIPPAGLIAIKQSLWTAYGSKLAAADLRDARLYRKCLATPEAQASCRRFEKRGKK
jgi:enoyl-CoA hydratase